MAQRAPTSQHRRWLTEKPHQHRPAEANTGLCRTHNHQSNQAGRLQQGETQLGWSLLKFFSPHSADRKPGRESVMNYGK